MVYFIPAPVKSIRFNGDIWDVIETIGFADRDDPVLVCENNNGIRACFWKYDFRWCGGEELPYPSRGF